uniref:non-specific serine/threonine protein kinase n=1 Tax=Callorhinchus milii TaxID=7868 RepID=A0A4W3GSN2_CALMI
CRPSVWPARPSETDRITVDEVKECEVHGYLLTSKRIGTGGFSSVYLGLPTQEVMKRNFRLASGLQTKRNKMVAIKIVNISQNPYQQSRRFLSREINALHATYKHPNIQLYETFRSPSQLFLVLELACKGDLLDHINRIATNKRDLGLREEEAQHLFHQLVSGVAHCHTNHIVHRDLKCENILLDEQGAIKLTDFGLAGRCTKRGLMSTFCGSVPYTAPEILLEQSYKGERADIWSMGVILYAMVTGKLPFNECQPQKMLQLIKRGIKFHQQLSPECQDLISQLLQWCPSARPELTQILAHPWMLPAISFIFQRVRDILTDSTDRSQHRGNSSKGMCRDPCLTRHCYWTEVGKDE